jgi:hypothetical protein
VGKATECQNLVVSYWLLSNFQLFCFRSCSRGFLKHTSSLSGAVHLAGKSIQIARVSLIALILLTVGCGGDSSRLPDGAVVGRASRYDYSPSAIQEGDEYKFWWCGQAVNPERHSQDSDAILYSSINTVTNVRFGPVTVLGETPGKWDSVYTCNPRVIGGTFVNPLGDGQTFKYAMYYVGTSAKSGTANSIGAAFSNDGITWNKLPEPVVAAQTTTDYGVAQPAAFNSDGKGAIWLFYEDSNAAPWNRHIQATSTDGVNFTIKGTLTTNGLDPTNPDASWGDIAYDPKTNYWYATYNLPARASSTTGGVSELESYGIQLYRIPNDSLLTGDTPWERLMDADTNSTGFESNFISAFLKDDHGNLNVGSYPTIQMYTAVSNPRPRWDASASAVAESAKVSHWDIASTVWVPGKPLLALNRYFNNKTHEVTTGWIDPKGGFVLEKKLGQLYQSPQNGATVQFFGCKAGSTDYFVSLDKDCEGKRLLGTNGFGYSQPVAGSNLAAIYSCQTDHDHFVSNEADCEGKATGNLLGYIVP